MAGQEVSLSRRVSMAVASDGVRLTAAKVRMKRDHRETESETWLGSKGMSFEYEQFPPQHDHA